MSLADQIRAMGKTERSTRVIADALGCRSEYVRVVLRQRVPGGSNPHKKYISARYLLGDRDAARAAMRAATKAAVANGANGPRVRGIAGSVYHSTMVKTGAARFNAERLDA